METTDRKGWLRRSLEALPHIIHREHNPILEPATRICRWVLELARNAMVVGAILALAVSVTYLSSGPNFKKALTASFQSSAFRNGQLSSEMGSRLGNGDVTVWLRTVWENGELQTFLETISPETYNEALGLALAEGSKGPFSQVVVCRIKPTRGDKSKQPCIDDSRKGAAYRMIESQRQNAEQAQRDSFGRPSRPVDNPQEDISTGKQQGPSAPESEKKLFEDEKQRLYKTYGTDSPSNSGAAIVRP